MLTSSVGRHQRARFPAGVERLSSLSFNKNKRRTRFYERRGEVENERARLVQEYHSGCLPFIHLPKPGPVNPPKVSFKVESDRINLVGAPIDHVHKRKFVWGGANE